MTPTSDERREVAEQLRKHNGRYYEELVNMSDSDLADLIDPTCRNGYSSLNDRSFLCSKCGYQAFTYDDSNCDPDEFEFCPNCGARVVSGDD